MPQARLKMSSDLMAREMARMKALVGSKAPASRGVDVDDLASRRDVAELRSELAKFRRHAAQEREVADGATHAQLEQLKRLVRSLEYKLHRDNVTESGGAEGDFGDGITTVGVT